ncbi:hypothetical protein DASC09_053220 [Saccharomycopsis crataegensis]|uniref:Zn(2)-C6 fungal-type domain-containing protein n=1 Tax=Saccharomycopsis crataegensis TaxID=43959 RepID=A0AAV5QTT6_9ASCO|nr:hypothetical protein DASC09_053220 [Saccharomycopsis crataegensis]
MKQHKQIKKSKYSRLGCFNCKRRRLKCGEELDSCFNCLDKGIRCSYLDLTPEQKQKVIDANIKNNPNYLLDPGNIGNQQGKIPGRRPMVESSPHFKNMKQELDKFQFSMGVSRFSIIPKVYGPNHTTGNNSDDSGNNISGKHANRNSYGKSNQYSINSIDNYDDNDKNTKSKNGHGQMNMHFARFNLNPSNHGFPLPNHENSATTFKLRQLSIRKYPRTFSSGVKFSVCGEYEEALAYARELMSGWFTDFSYCSWESLAVYNGAISRAMALILVNMEKDCYKSSMADRSPTIIGNLQKWRSHYKLKGLRHAQNVIESLNQPQLASSIEYLRYFRYLLHYSLINIGLTLQSKAEYSSLAAFINGFISSSLSSEVVDKVSKDIQYQYCCDAEIQEEQKYTEFMFSSVRDFYSKIITKVFVPSYRTDSFKEFFQELLNFESFLSYQNLNPYSVARFQLNDLIKFISNQVLGDQKLLDSFNPNFVTEHNVVLESRFTNGFFDFFPSEIVYFQQVHKSINTIDKIMYLHWSATAYFLDNIFPEAEYFFSAKFSGSIHWAGFNMDLINDILKDLQNLYANSQITREVYEFLYRRTIYLTRMISFLATRHRDYVCNLELIHPFSKTPSVFKERFRFASRKPKFVKELQLTSFKTGAIIKENYPANDPSLIEQLNTADSISMAQLNHPANIRYNDSKTTVNKNVDQRYFEVTSFLDNSTNPFNVFESPLELMELSDSGLLKNIDYQPVMNPKFNQANFFNFLDLKMVLQSYSEDKDMILSHSKTLC